MQVSLFQPLSRLNVLALYKAVINAQNARLMDVLTKQGMQPNQQITFLSDGADNLLELQWMMCGSRTPVRLVPYYYATGCTGEFAKKPC